MTIIKTMNAKIKMMVSSGSNSIFRMIYWRYSNWPPKRIKLAQRTNQQGKKYQTDHPNGIDAKKNKKKNKRDKERRDVFLNFWGYLTFSAQVTYYLIFILFFNFR